MKFRRVYYKILKKKNLHRVDDAIGVKRDLSCGFYQVPLPLAARCKFRFSSKGRTYEMNVLPMGHRCAPEIMHTITSALGGLITVCSAKSAFTRGAMDVYVDGVRFSGTVEQAQEYARFVDKRCDEMGGKFKEKGHEPTQHYVFNGVHYDHVNHKVSLGPRVVRKLQNDRFYSLSFKDLEAAVGRLLYASAVLGIVIPRFHFAVKIVQRRINLLNRCPWIGNKSVDLPRKTRIILAQWRDEVVLNTPIKAPLHPDFVPHKHRLYTDASRKGWGGILYLDTGEVLITGKPWEAGTTYEVNNAEATAVRLALEEFGEHFESGTCLDLFVDNTSCKEALNRKTSKSDNIARQLRMVLEEAKRKGICIQARYIASSENPADPISRKF